MPMTSNLEVAGEKLLLGGAPTPIYPSLAPSNQYWSLSLPFISKSKINLRSSGIYLIAKILSRNGGSLNKYNGGIYWASDDIIWLIKDRNCPHHHHPQNYICLFFELHCPHSEQCNNVCNTLQGSLTSLRKTALAKYYSKQTAMVAKKEESDKWHFRRGF